ncbi:MAG: hypothetical protein ACXAEI_18200 [Candidatus Hodarchaeales archaeon]|jgi:hypothetical protein
MSDIIPTLNFENWKKALNLPVIGILVLEVVLLAFTLADDNFPGREDDNGSGFRAYSSYLFFSPYFGGLISIALVFGLWLGYSVMNSEGNFGDAAILGLILGLIFGLIHVTLFWIMFPEPDSETELAEIVWFAFYIAVLYLSGTLAAAGFKSSNMGEFSSSAK